MKCFKSVIAVCLLAAFTVQAKPLRVLAIGNSYTQSLEPELPRLAAAAGVELDLAIFAIGGKSLRNHWMNCEAAEKDPSVRPYKVKGRKTNLPEMLADGTWDVVTFQEQSADGMRAACFDPWADRLVRLVRERQPAARLFFQLTWSDPVYSPRISDDTGGPGSLRMTQAEMSAALVSNYTAQARRLGVGLIPVGPAVDLFRRRLPVTARPVPKATCAALKPGELPDIGGELSGWYWWGKGRSWENDAQEKRLRFDFHHLNEAGRYLQACVWLATLTGTDVGNLPSLPENAGDDLRRNAALLRRCAMEAVSAGTGGWTIPKRLEKYVRIEGNRLIVDVPAGETNVCAYATRSIDLSDFAQSRVEAHVRCRGTDVVRDPRPARGVKLALHHTDPVSGERRYPSAKAPESGTFDWTDLDLGVSFGEVPPTAGSKAQLVLGLQQTSGHLEFDLSSFSCQKAPPLFPTRDHARLVSYPARITGLPRMRGVMGRGVCRNTERDIEDLKAYGANLVRLQMNGFQVKKPSGKEGKERTLADWDRWLAKNLDHAEEVLGWLEKRDMMMVLDLHNPPLKGYGKDGDVFYVQAHADRLVSAWREIAQRFKGRKGIYGYDIMNEPAQTRRALPDCDYWNLQRRAAEAIRAVDPDATVIVESNDWDGPSGFGYLPALDMDNVIYQVHMYRPGAFTHQGANGAARPPADRLLAYPNAEKGWDKAYLRQQLEPVRQFQKRHKAKILVGEFSACIYGPGAGDYLADCISLFEEYGWDWTYHSFREALWWNVETVVDERTGKPVPDKDNPRFRALVDGFQGRVRRDVGKERKVRR